MQIEEHWLQEARHCPSPFYDARPQAEISLLVIHNIALPPLTYGGTAIEQLFSGNLSSSAHPYFAQLKDLKVSAHLLIRRTGELVQFVAFNQRAWHAGASSFAGRTRCNDFALGIEMEGSDMQPYTQSQYQQLLRVSAALMRAYPAITLDRICGHSHLAPERKTDPGPAFNWHQYLHALQHLRGSVK